MPNEDTLQKTLEQGRAKFAYGCAEEGKSIQTKHMINGEWYEDNKYKSYVKKLPMLIKTNGLGSAIAFYISKRRKEKDKKAPGQQENPKNAYDLIYYQLIKWLKDEPTGLVSESLAINNDDLIKVIITLESTQYRALTNEVLAFLTWLKRFAEGLIEGEADER